MDAVRKLILAKVEEKQTTLSDLSKKLGRSHSYLQQFVRRGVPKKLDEDDRPVLARELGVDESELKDGPAKEAKPSINHTNTPVEPTIAPNVNLSKSPNSGAQLGSITPGDQLVGQADLPVFALAQGGRGALIVTDNPVDWVLRPDPLARVRDGYGMIVMGDSMSPRIESGSIALVNPHLPPRPKALCIFRRHADDGTVEACIKELVRFTDENWHVKQYNPAKTFTLKRSQWQVCHVTVGLYFSR